MTGFASLLLMKANDGQIEMKIQRVTGDSRGYEKAFSIENEINKLSGFKSLPWSFEQRF